MNLLVVGTEQQAVKIQKVIGDSWKVIAWGQHIVGEEFDVVIISPAERTAGLSRGSK